MVTYELLSENRRPEPVHRQFEQAMQNGAFNRRHSTSGEHRLDHSHRWVLSLVRPFFLQPPSHIVIRDCHACITWLRLNSWRFGLESLGLDFEYRQKRIQQRVPIGANQTTVLL